MSTEITTKNRKMMLCTYCASHSANNEKDKKCQLCEYNPQLVNNFDLGESAIIAIEEGVLTNTGAILMLKWLNDERLHYFENVFNVNNNLPQYLKDILNTKDDENNENK